jgi:hypothetical protein
MLFRGMLRTDPRPVWLTARKRPGKSCRVSGSFGVARACQYDPHRNDFLFNLKALIVAIGVGTPLASAFPTRVRRMGSIGGS